MTSTSQKDTPQDPECARLIALARELFTEEMRQQVFKPMDSQTSSYYEDHDALKHLPEPLCDHAFDNPVQLKAQLEALWRHQGCPEMQAFATTASVAAFKQACAPKDEAPKGLPAFIYQF